LKLNSWSVMCSSHVPAFHILVLLLVSTELRWLENGLSIALKGIFQPARSSLLLRSWEIL
jgi:hypothetical protein